MTGLRILRSQGRLKGKGSWGPLITHNFDKSYYFYKIQYIRSVSKLLGECVD